MFRCQAACLEGVLCIGDPVLSVGGGTTDSEGDEDEGNNRWGKRC